MKRLLIVLSVMLGACAQDPNSSVTVCEFSPLWSVAGVIAIILITAWAVISLYAYAKAVLAGEKPWL